MSQADMNQDKRAGSPLIEVSHVSKCFGEHQVLTDVTADFNAGEVAVIVGASGSGKSTFGEQYDSLADMISFGAAPALVIYSWALTASRRAAPAT